MHKASNPGQYLCGFLIPPVVFHLRVLCEICLQGCFPPIGIFLVAGFVGALFSCMSMPMAVNGLSKMGFLGVCLVCVMFPIEYKGYISIFKK